MKVKRLFFLLLGGGLILAVLFGINFNRIRTLGSFRKIADYPFYVMHYYGDYGFKDFLGRYPAAQNDSESAENMYSCTCFSAQAQDGNIYFGRNFDWYDHPSLLLFTDPPDGYASVSMVDLSYLGFDREDMPGIFQRSALLRAPFLPFDGMNEKGLAVGMMAVGFADSGYDPGKPILSSLEIIRLLLDEAADVEEALHLMSQYNIDFEGGPPLHYMIADRSGESVVVEFVDGEMIILRSDQPWQVSTNFLISQTPDNLVTCRRYQRASQMLESYDGGITEIDALAILQEVSQVETIWSVVYDITGLRANVAIGRDFQTIYPFEILR